MGINSVSDDDLRWLLALLEEENLAEIEVRDEGFAVLVRAGETGESSSAAADDQKSSANLSPNQIPVLCPIAGVFYRTSSPEVQPFVEVGNQVEYGDTVGLIEAMKLFNEVPSPASGVVVSVLVENEQSVEEDQVLMIIETRTEDDI